MVGVWPWRTSSTSVGGGGAGIFRAMVGSQPIVGLRVLRSPRRAAAGRARGDRRAGPAPASWPGGSRWRAEKRAAFRDEEYWGRPGPGLRRSRRPDRDRGPGPGRPRRQPHRADVHRRPFGRLPLRRPPPRRPRQPADEHRPRRRASARPACGSPRPVRCAPPANKPTPDGARHAACPSWSGSSSWSTPRVFVTLGAFGYQGLCAILGVPSPRPRFAPRRRGAAARRPLDPRQLPREPAEHLHRHPHRADARRRAGEPGAPVTLRAWRRAAPHSVGVRARARTSPAK